jgi:hypothetical protein
MLMINREFVKAAAWEVRSRRGLTITKPSSLVSRRPLGALFYSPSSDVCGGDADVRPSLESESRGTRLPRTLAHSGPIDMRLIRVRADGTRMPAGSQVHSDLRVPGTPEDDMIYCSGLPALLFLFNIWGFDLLKRTVGCIAVAYRHWI